MINEATKAKKLGYDLTKINHSKTGLPVKPDRDDPRNTSQHEETIKGFKSIFSKLEPRLKPIFDELDMGNYEEIKHTIFISFTSIPKLGLNPRSKYNTPNGIYSYQLNNRNYKDLINNNLPFATHQPFVQFFKIKPQFFDNIAVISGPAHGNLPASSPTLYECYSIFAKKYPHITKNNFLKIYRGPNTAHYRDLNVWEIEILAKEQDIDFLKAFEETVWDKAESHFKRASNLRCLWTLGYSLGNINKWTHLFVNDFKIYGVIDEGTSTIHPSEPYQSVFFSSAFIEHLATIDNPYLEPKREISLSNPPHTYWKKKNKKDGSIEEYYHKTLQTKEWLNNQGKRHRVGGPAFIEYHTNGVVSQLKYYLNGNLESIDDKPAVLKFNYEGKLRERKWYKDDGLYRENGPAIEDYNEINNTWVGSYYFVNGNITTQYFYEQYINQTKPIQESKNISKIRIVLK